MICDNILDAIGGTPLIRLSSVLPDLPFKLYGKIEALNPGGSAKDRPAALMLQAAIEAGLIGPNTTIVESSSGNMAVGLAQACACLDLRLICVVDDRTTAQHLKLLSVYGASADVVRVPDPDTGEFLHARMARVKALLEQIDDAFWPNQYANPQNAHAHRRTVEEICDATDEPVDYLVCATSTCGTLRGCSDHIGAHDLPTRLVAVDALGSAIFGATPHRRLVPGHGASLRPALFEGARVDQVIHVSDLDCVVGCRRLVAKEGILAGGSSGGVIQAIDLMRDSIPDDAVCVAILVDSGERYLETVFSDTWVAEHFGDVSHLWKGSIHDGRAQPVVVGS